MRTLVFAATLLLAAGSVTAQQASYTFFGQGCLCTPLSGEPHLSVVGVPQIGGSFVIRAPRSYYDYWTGGQQAWILTGFSNTLFGGVTLPFDLSIFTQAPFHFCGSLLTSVVAMESTSGIPAGASGYAEVVYSVPNATSLVGLSFYQQVFMHGYLPLGGEHYCTSRGGHGVIGR